MAKKESNWFVRHKVWTGIFIVIGLIIIAGALGGGSKTTTTSTVSETSQQPTATSENSVATIGQPVRDGKFEFTVKSIACGKASVGTNEYFTKNAQGQYCLLDVTVKNIGNETQSLFSSNQKLLNGEVEYSADDTATLYAAPQSSSWYSDINPGNSVEGIIVFDVPKGVTPTIVELHDSAFSNGVEVSLQ